MGDRLVVTGSYQAGGTSIALGGILAEINAIIVNPSATQNQQFEEGTQPDESDLATLKVLDTATFSGTTITISPEVLVGRPKPVPSWSSADETEVIDYGDWIR